MNKEMNAYGLTGNMGCGKSTVGEFLQKHNACESGMTENNLIGLHKKQKVQYAIFAAEQVLHIYEKKYPDTKGD